MSITDSPNVSQVVKEALMDRARDKRIEELISIIELAEEELAVLSKNCDHLTPDGKPAKCLTAGWEDTCRYCCANIYYLSHSLLET